MESQGWIVINRSICSHWIWEDARRLKWWLDLLLSASYRDQQTMLHGRLVTVRRGQLIASVSYLMSRWAYTGDDERRHKPTQGTILKFLKMLEKEGMIAIDKKTLPNRTTLITILNYSKYQGIGNSVDLPPHNTDNNTGNNTDNNEYNNINNINNNTHINARAREKTPKKEQWRQDIAKDSVFWEQSAMAMRCGIDWLKSLLEPFHSENIACDFNEATYSDYRRDFFNYARKENQNRTRNANQTKHRANSGSCTGGSSASIGGHGLNE